MLKKFTTKQLILLTLLTVLAFVVSFAVGQVLVVLTGIPTAGGIWSIFVVLLTFTLGAKIVGKFGAISLMGLLTALISVPTPAIGPPGIYKLPIVFLAFLLADGVVSLFRRKNIGYYSGLILAVLLYNPIMYYSLIFLGIPAAEKLREVIVFLTLGHAVVGLFGVYFGIYFYNRIKNKKLIRQIQS